MDPILLSLDEAKECLGLGRSKLLDMAYRGELPSIKVGRRRLFPVEGLQRWARDQMVGILVNSVTNE